MSQAVHPQQFHHPAHPSQAMLASGLNFIGGIYLLISEWINAASGASRGNGIIFGIIVAILAATRFRRATGPWASWLNALIGIWIIITPWVYGFAGQPWMWNSILVGIIMLVLGVWTAVSSGTTFDHHQPSPKGDALHATLRVRSRRVEGE